MKTTGFLRRYPSVPAFCTRLLDLLAIAAGARLAHGLVNLIVPGLPDEKYVLVTLIALLITALVFPLFNLYETWRGQAVGAEIRLTVSAWWVVCLSMALLGVVTKSNDEFSRLWMGTWTVCGTALLILFRLMIRFTLHWARAQGHNQRRVVIVGAGELAQRAATQLRESPWAGFRLLGFFAERPLPPGLLAPRLGGLDDIADYVERNDVDQVWLAIPWTGRAELEQALANLRYSTADIHMVPDLFSYALFSHSLTMVVGLPLLNLSASPLQGLNRIVKNLEDRLLALLVLILVSPLLLVIAIGVKLSSPGPVFYRQERVSLKNKTFLMLKFRSMPLNAESGSGPVWAKPGEQRATRFGAFLRRTSLDELPQFINVLKGEMSIVGPRPERPVFVERFKHDIHGYMQKHLVKAGITGWAQVNGWRGDTDLQKRIEHDLYYIEHWSLWFDLKIIGLTIIRGFIHKHAY